MASSPDRGVAASNPLRLSRTRPFLMVNAPGLAPGRCARTTSIVDIAPTLLGFLGLPTDGMDGRSLL